MVDGRKLSIALKAPIRIPWFPGPCPMQNLPGAHLLSLHSLLAPNSRSMHDPDAEDPMCHEWA
eukprot:scaffold32762_cov43-Prasinocladus_malaysianus.AAC.2